MEGRRVLGLVFVFIGLILLLIGSFLGNAGFFVFLFYSLPLIVIGIVISLNKKEDEIEQVDYSKMKKEEKKNGKK